MPDQKSAFSSGSIVDRYREIVKARGGYWTSRRQRAVEAISRVLRQHGRVTVTLIDEETNVRGEHARYTLNELADEELLMRVTERGKHAWYEPGNEPSEDDDDQGEHCDVTLPPRCVDEVKGLFATMRKVKPLDDQLRVARGRLHLAVVHLASAAAIIESVAGDLKPLHDRGSRMADDARALEVIAEIAEAAGLHRHQIAAAIGIDPEAPLDLRELDKQVDLAMDVYDLRQMGDRFAGRRGEPLRKKPRQQREEPA